MSLKGQRRLASSILKVGEGRVWIDPNRNYDVEVAITREEIRRLIHEGAIRRVKKQGVSRSRVRIIQKKKKKGLRRGSGSRTGSARAKISKKKSWTAKITLLRRRLRELRAKHLLTDGAYRRLYNLAGGGSFRSTVDLERYIESHNMWRRR